MKIKTAKVKKELKTDECFLKKKDSRKECITRSRKSARVNFQEVKKYTESIQTRKVKKARKKDHYIHFERNVKLSQGRDAIFCVSKRFYFQRSYSRQLRVGATNHENKN